LTEAATLSQSRAYAQIMFEKLLETSPENAAADKWAALSASLKARGKLEEGLALEERGLSEILDDPMLYKERILYEDYKTLTELKKYLADNGLDPKELLSSPEKRAELAAKPEIFMILVWEMQRKAEKEAMHASGVIKN
jgi:hypothetical protein